MDWLIEFQVIHQDNIYSIEKIEWWLLKNSAVQKDIHHFINNQHLFDLEDGTTVRLPPFGKNTKQEKFLDLYEALDTISQFHRYEKYFEQELTAYHQIKKSKADLKIWVAKNEYFGADKYVCFLLDYLDYDEDDKVEHLNVFVPSIKEIDIYVNRKDFKYIIEFLEIFNHLYWVQDILPESLEKIKSSIN